MIRYPTTSELIFINGRLMNDAAIQTGKQKIRDIDLLQAAELRPQASAFGEDAFQTLPEKAAALLHAIARNHPFKDGNKRTATVAALFLLGINGYAVNWMAQSALDRIVALAEGQQTLERFSTWLSSVLIALPEHHAPEPDADRDVAHIDALIDAHRWLLDELAKR